MDLVAQLSNGRKLLFGSGVLLLLVSLFRWNEYDAGFVSVGWNAWATGRGKIFGIALLLLLAWEGLLLAAKLGKAKLPELPVDAPLISLGLGAITVVFGVLRVFQESVGRTFWAWLALLLLIALAAGLFLRWQEGESASAPPAPSA
jgi:hypothetical protein